MKTKILSIIALLSVLVLPAIALAATDDVEIYVNVSISAVIEVSPATATFNLVTPGVDSFPDSQAFTITNVGSVNFTQMYVSVDVPTEEATNPLGTGNPVKYEAGGFVVLMNETMFSSNNWKFVGRQEWNLTDGKPEDYKGHESTWAKAWGYFGNNSRQYFWELSNGTDGYCNSTGTVLKIKKWAVNGTPAAYDLTDGVTGSLTAGGGKSWGVNTFTGGSPLDGYCVATYRDCDKIYIYQWDHGSDFPTCGDNWYIYEDPIKFKPNDQFHFNITVWVPKGIPAGDTSSSTLTVTAS